MQYERLADALHASRRPVIIAGHGVLLSPGGSDALRELATLAGAPVAETLLGVSSWKSADGSTAGGDGDGDTDDGTLYAGMLGMHGCYAANCALAECDLVIGVGCRFDDRVVMNLGRHGFAPKAHLVARIDIDASAPPKNSVADVNVADDAARAMRSIACLLRMHAVADGRARRAAWRRTIAAWHATHPVDMPDATRMGAAATEAARTQCSEFIASPTAALRLIDDTARELGMGDRVVVSDVGQHQMWVVQASRFSAPNTHQTSGGLGTMGFSVPAAIGVQLAAGRGRLVVSIAGDGGFQMTMQELAVVRDERLPVKFIVVNNEGLGMVRQQQHLVYGRREHAVDLCSTYDGGGGDGLFVGIARAYGIHACRVRSMEELRTAWREALTAKRDEPVLIDVVVDKAAMVMPTIVAGAKTLAEMAL